MAGTASNKEVYHGRLDCNILYADGAIKLANIERPNGLKTSRILANAKKLRYA